MLNVGEIGKENVHAGEMDRILKRLGLSTHGANYHGLVVGAVVQHAADIRRTYSDLTRSVENEFGKLNIWVAWLRLLNTMFRLEQGSEHWLPKLESEPASSEPASELQEDLDYFGKLKPMFENQQSKHGGKDIIAEKWRAFTYKWLRLGNSYYNGKRTPAWEELY